MFDINNIVNAAITEAVNARLTEVLQQHANITAALAERIAALENQAIVTSNAVDARIAALEFCNADNHQRLRVLEGALTDRVVALEGALTDRVVALEDRIAVLAAELIADKPAITIDEARMVEALNSQEWFWEKLQNRIDAATEQAVDNHCETYDHDSYDSAVSTVEDTDFDGLVTNDSLEDAVREAVGNLSFDISVS